MKAYWLARRRYRRLKGVLRRQYRFLKGVLRRQYRFLKGVLRRYLRKCRRRIIKTRNRGDVNRDPSDTPFSIHQLLMEGIPAQKPVLETAIVRDGRYTARWEFQLEASQEKRVAFVFAATDKFLTGFEAAILSLRRVHPEATDKIFLVHDGSVSNFFKTRLSEMGFKITYVEAALNLIETAMQAPSEAENHKRVGKYGYMNLEALRITGFDRVIIFDTDLLFLGRLDGLWKGDTDEDFRVIADIGERPIADHSELTGHPVFNSGVISIPGKFCSQERWEDALEKLREYADVRCSQLDRFADQRFWNIYLHQQSMNVSYVSQSLNANRKLIEKFYQDSFADVSVIHYTGSKPWFEFESRDLVTAEDLGAARKLRRKFPSMNSVWIRSYKIDLRDERIDSFSQRMNHSLRDLKDMQEGEKILLIGNGPSLKKLDFSSVASAYKIAFNWFPRHDDFDRIKVDDLVILSHMFFGGWQSKSPSVPKAFIDLMKERSWKPRLWFPYYFSPLIDRSELSKTHEICYLLYEKPFKHFSDDTNAFQHSVYDFLSDTRTSVTAGGVPLALHLGASEIYLVGCDGSYADKESPKHFYSDDRHGSLETPQNSLDRVWVENGPAHTSFKVVARTLEEFGIGLYNTSPYSTAVPLKKKLYPGISFADGTGRDDAFVS